MTDIHEKYAVNRVIEQKKIEKTDSITAIGISADDEKRTTLSLSLTVSDKKALKMMAAEREMTIAAIIHEWVQEHIEEVDE